MDAKIHKERSFFRMARGPELMKRFVAIVAVLIVLLMHTGRAYGQDETPPIPESPGECSVLAGIAVGIMMASGGFENLDRTEEAFFVGCVSGKKQQVIETLKQMLESLFAYRKIREDCAFKVGRDSYKGSLISSSATQKAIEDCVAIKWGK